MIELTIIAAEAREYWAYNYGFDMNLATGPIRCARCGEWGFEHGCGIYFEEHPDDPEYWGPIGSKDCSCRHFDYIFSRGAGKSPASQPWELKQHFCKACVVILTPYAYRLRDIAELSSHCWKLEKTINDKRREQGNQDDGATSDGSRQRGQGRSRRRPSNRQGHGAA